MISILAPPTLVSPVCINNMVKEPLVDRVPLPDQTTFKNSLQPGYSEGSDHTLQELR
jgi:hypothetical protein